MENSSAKPISDLTALTARRRYLLPAWRSSVVRAARQHGRKQFRSVRAMVDERLARSTTPGGTRVVAVRPFDMSRGQQHRHQGTAGTQALALCWTEDRDIAADAWAARSRNWAAQGTLDDPMETLWLGTDKRGENALASRIFRPVLGFTPRPYPAQTKGNIESMSLTGYSLGSCTSAALPRFTTASMVKPMAGCQLASLDEGWECRPQFRGLFNRFWQAYIKAPDNSLAIFIPQSRVLPCSSRPDIALTL
jgi:hypothetical protein